MAVEQTLDQRRAAFLDGEGTLTLEEVREWAQELVPNFSQPDYTPYGLTGETLLMVSVV